VAADVVLTTRDGPVVTVTINRPDQRNALSPAVSQGLRAALAAARTDDEARVVVLRGAGDRAFCAGADLSSMTQGAGFLDLHRARGEIAGVFEDLWSLGKPTIARVQGYALAGGFGLALACDFLVAADDAVFGTPEIDVGLWPFMITVPILRAMTPKQGLELMMTGRRVQADEALRMGIANRVVPAAELDDAVGELAASLASKSPAVMQLGRSTFYRVVDDLQARALPYLLSQLTINASFEDAAEGVAAFKEKRSPVWRGR